MIRPAANPAAAGFPAPREGDWRVGDFLFHGGEVLPELRLHYRTIGAPGGEPVLVLHGTAGSGASLLTTDFAGQLFGEHQPLDARRHFIILPDAIGAGASSKPSDGLRMGFPRYNCDDLVAATYRLLTEHLGVAHLRLVLGYSLGGMMSWLIAAHYPAFIDAAVPLACQPGPMAGRNWLLRRLLTDSIRRDPAWQDGNYTSQPAALRFASVFYDLASNGGNLGLQQAAPTREAADRLLDRRLAEPLEGDANDLLYQWEATRDYDPTAGLERIEASLLAINSADDERNPPELGVLDRALSRVKYGRALLLPPRAGHATVLDASLWADELGRLLQSAPRRAAGGARRAI